MCKIITSASQIYRSGVAYRYLCVRVSVGESVKERDTGTGPGHTTHTERAPVRLFITGE